MPSLGMRANIAISLDERSQTSQNDICATQRGNVSTGQFPVGHMVYIESKSLGKLKQDVAAFMASALH